MRQILSMVWAEVVAVASSLGLFGVFITSLIGSASIIFPIPAFALVITAGTVFNPVVVGVVAGLGSAIGELTGYGVGYGIRRAKHRLRKENKLERKLEKEEKKWDKTFRGYFHRKLGFVLIVLFAVTPLPDDIIGVFCGLVHYDVKRFFVATLIGKTVQGIVLAYIGLLGTGLFFSLF